MPRICSEISLHAVQSSIMLWVFLVWLLVGRIYFIFVCVIVWLSRSSIWEVPTFYYDEKQGRGHVRIRMVVIVILKHVYRKVLASCARSIAPHHQIL